MPLLMDAATTPPVPFQLLNLVHLCGKALAPKFYPLQTQVSRLVEPVNEPGTREHVLLDGDI